MPDDDANFLCGLVGEKNWRVSSAMSVTYDWSAEDVRPYLTN